MSSYDFYQIDAFTDGPFTGNPAAIIPLKQWIDDALMQNIALENNLSETAFFVPQGDDYQIRWFTPLVEVDLCGHATLASAYTIFNHLDRQSNQVTFHSKSGPLYVSKENDLLILNFPTDTLVDIPANKDIEDAIGQPANSSFKGSHDLVLVYDNADIIAAMKPNFNELSRFDLRGVLVTAPGFDDFDFVSRGFFPATGINEDPATGSAHTTLTPYWAKSLDKTTMKALQMSQRKGFFNVEYKNDRTLIMGKGQLYAEGKIYC